MLYTWFFPLILVLNSLNKQGTDGFVTSVKSFLLLLIQSNHIVQQKVGYISRSYGRLCTNSLKSFKLSMVHNVK